MAASLRREIKYKIHPTLVASLRRDLARWLRGDPHGAPDTAAYDVFSLYYDTPDLELYRDKADGEGIRAKVRLRYYAPDTEEPWLEVKRRLHGAMCKDRVRVRLRDGYSTPALLRTTDDNPAAGIVVSAGLPMNLYPVVRVMYRRSAFTSVGQPAARVTLDENVEALAITGGLNRRVLRGKWAILELKVGAAVPAWWRVLIKKYGLNDVSASKYSMAVEAVVPGKADFR